MLAKNINLYSEWLDLNQELGVDKFQTLFVQNKSCGSVYLWPRNTIPENNKAGAHLKIGEYINISGSGESVYCRGFGEIYVSVMDTAVVSSDQYALTDAQLRASPLPVSISSFSLPSGAATSENQISEIILLNDIIESLEPITYTSRLDEVSDSLFYVGKAIAGSLESEPKWQIARYTQTGGILKSEYASSLFDKVWSDRLTLVYV